MAARLLVGQVCRQQTQPPPGVAIGRVALDPLAQVVGLVLERLPAAVSARRAAVASAEESAADVAADPEADEADEKDQREASVDPADDRAL